MAFSSMSLAVINFIYGASFMVMAVMLWVWLERTGKLGIAARLNLLAAFGIAHGLSDITDAALRLPGVDTDPGGPVAAARFALLAISFVFLLWFGATGVIDDSRLQRVIVAFGILGLSAMTAGVAALYAQGLSGGSLQSVERAIRLFLGVPGGVLSAIAFLRVATRCTLLGFRDCALGGKIAALGMGAYTFFAGVMATGYPNSLLVAGLPVQLHRMAAALVLTFGALMMLQRLEVGRTQELRAKVG